ncbi:MAG: ATP-binding protein [Planctomycetota bacterium]
MPETAKHGDTRCRPLPRPDQRTHDQPPAPAPGGKVVLSWSGGKDSAMALHALQQDPTYEVVGLLTTLSAEHQRISHHGVREALLDAQAAAIGLPVHKLHYGPDPSHTPEQAMAAFEAAMDDALAQLRRHGVFHVAFGDIFLEDLRRYRERRLREVGMRALFPLWGHDTTALLHRFSRDGFAAVVTCAEPIAVPLIGVELSSDLLATDWPSGVDPCGERGEFHSFVHRGPVFGRPVRFSHGVTIVRDGRHYHDLLPADDPAAEP